MNINKFKNKRVILRVDLNVPIFNNEIKNDRRIKSILPTINEIIKLDIKKLIIISHLQRPNGKYNKNMTLIPIYNYLKKIYDIGFIKYEKNYKLFFKNADIANDKILLLDNIRFYKQEEKLDKDFCNYLTNLCDIFVNDSFGTIHRKHSSIVGINPPLKMYGLLIEKELRMFNMILHNKNNKKICAIIGGSKVCDKIKLLFNLIDKVNCLIIGGGMAFTFVKVLNNTNIGNSLFDNEGGKIIKSIAEKCKKKNVELCLPIDYVVNDSFSDKGDIQIMDIVPEGFIGLDIGMKTVKYFTTKILKNDIILWNGPMGVFEMEPFKYGSEQLLKNILHKILIIGGGDTAKMVDDFGYQDKVTFISTGGGASLKLLENIGKIDIL